MSKKFWLIALLVLLKKILIGNASLVVAVYGMSFGWCCFHSRFYTAGEVDTLVKDWNSTVMRAEMGIEPEKGYKEDSAAQLKLMTTVIYACIKECLYIIIDWHWYNINLKEAKSKTMTIC